MDLLTFVMMAISLLCAFVSAGLVMVVIWIGYWMLNS